jgi:hypothetical protein
MSRFAVGDRVMVIDDRRGTGHQGKCGMVQRVYSSPTCDVLLEGEKQDFGFSDVELGFANENSPMRAIDLYAGRVVKLYQADFAKDDTCRWVVIKGESDEALLCDLVYPSPGVPLKWYECGVLVYKATVCAVEPTKFTVDDVREAK